MRNSFSGGGGGRVLEEEEEEEEEDEFYESLDRVLSSSCSSTSASDDDADHSQSFNLHRRHRTTASASYDVWLSEPSSVEERRTRLLQKLDLVGDHSLSRPKSTIPVFVNVDVLKSDNADGVDITTLTSDSVTRSDGATVDQLLSSDLSASLGKSSSSSGTYDTVDEDEEEDRVRGDDDGGGDGNFPIDYVHLEDKVMEKEEFCTIKNLDNGEEFVVKEVREKGTWKKLQVVGRGRKLSLEEFQNSVVGHSPIVQELLRRQNQENRNGSKKDKTSGKGSGNGAVQKEKKKGGWLRSIKNAAGAVVHRKERKSSDEKDTSSENCRRRSSSATDDSLDVPSHHGSERVKVKHYGSSLKELTGLYLNQEIHAHSGSIWAVKFNLDGKYLASAGEDCVIHIWKVEFRKKGDSMTDKGLGAVDNTAHSIQFAAVSNGSSEAAAVPSNLDRDSSERRRRSKIPGGRKSFSSENVVIPEYAFVLLEKPVHSFHGHGKDVLDLSWSRTERLLSSSMDKTVRLWDLSSSSCLRIFSHNDYVTCIQFNPIDDNHFISGSLDGKVCIWNIENRQVENWNELHEMVTAACFTPDGQGAFVGSHKGNCHFFRTSDHKLEQKSQITLQSKKKKSHLKKITGFEFIPRSSSEVFITSADSRIRVVDDLQLVHKFKGFRNKTSQISASLTSDGKHVICASEDSHVYVWRYEADSRPSRNIGAVTMTQSYEHFHCQDVSVAVAWPGTPVSWMSGVNNSGQNEECISQSSLNMEKTVELQHEVHFPPLEFNAKPQQSSVSSENSVRFTDRVSVTWPEEKLVTTPHLRSSQSNEEFNGHVHSNSAWGMVIVTAGRDGEIKTFQNFGYPIRV